MSKCITVMLLTFAAVSFTGCAHITILRTQELRAVRDHVDSLNVQLAELQKKILEEQKTQGEIIRLMRADQQVRLGEINQKVSDIDGNLSENQVRLSRIGEQTSEFQKKLEAKMASDSAAATSRTAEIDKLLQIAMGDFNAGRYDVAFNGFKDLCSQFPESPQAQDAEYWSAECLLAKKSYDDAEKAYIGYIKKYPKGTKIGISLYKLGLAYEKEGKTKQKEIVWKKLLEQYPDSPEAQMVKGPKKG